MINTSTEIIDNLLMDNHLVKQAYAVFYTSDGVNHRVEASGISAFNIQYDCMPTNHIGMGNVIPGVGDISIYQQLIDFIPTEVERYTIHEIITGTPVEGTGVGVDVTLGTFYPDNRSTDGSTLTFNGYDILSILDKDYSEEDLLSGDQMAPHTPKNWINRAFQACGFQGTLTMECENDDAYYVFNTLRGTIMPQQEFDTFRTFVGCMAAACGCNIVAGRELNTIKLVSMAGNDQAYNLPDGYVPISENFGREIQFTTIKFVNYSKIATGTKKDIYDIDFFPIDGSKRKRYKYGKNPIIDPQAMWDEVDGTRGYIRARNRIRKQLVDSYTFFSYELTSLPVFDIGDIIGITDTSGVGHTCYIGSWSYSGTSLIIGLGDPASGSSVSSSGGAGLGTVTVSGKIANAINTVDNQTSEAEDVTVLKQSETYLYEADLSEDATAGDLMEQVSAEHLHADRWLDVAADGVLAGIPDGEGNYIYYVDVELRDMINATWLGQEPLISQNSLIIMQSGSKLNNRSYWRKVHLQGKARLKITSPHKGTFFVQDASPSIYPDVYLQASQFNSPIKSELPLDYNNDFLVNPNIPNTNAFSDTRVLRVYAPVDESHVTDIRDDITVEIDELSDLRFVTSNGENTYYKEEYDDIDNPTMHRWGTDYSDTLTKIDFDRIINITNTSVVRNYRSLWIRLTLDIDEQYREGEETYTIQQNTYIYKNTDIVIDLMPSYGGITPIPPGDELDDSDKQLGATKNITPENKLDLIWAEEYHSSSIDPDTNLATLTDMYFPFRRYGMEKWDYTFGSAPNLVDHQKLRVILQDLTVNQNYANSKTSWTPIEEDIGHRPFNWNTKTLTIPEISPGVSGYIYTCNKLIVDENGNIDVENSPSNLYKMYLKLLAVEKSDNQLHLVECGAENSIDKGYTVIDVIGFHNDFVSNVKSVGRITLIGSANKLSAFENYENVGLEGIFVGINGTGLSISSQYGLQFYENYNIAQIKPIIYTLSNDGYTVFLNGDDGSVSSVTIDPITYQLSSDGYTITLTGSDGSITSANIDLEWATEELIDESIDEIFGTEILTTESGDTLITEDGTYRIEV